MESPDAAPVIVTLLVPTVAAAVVVSVRVLVVCPATMVDGLNVPATPAPSPETESDTGPVNDPLRVTVMLTVPLAACAIETADDVVMVNDPVGVGVGPVPPVPSLLPPQATAEVEKNRMKARRMPAFPRNDNR